MTGLHPWLTLVPVDDAPRLEPLADGRYVIGSDPGCDRVVTTPGVSRRHAAIVLRDGAAEVEDLGSKNGTRVDGVLVSRAALPVGAVLVLGRAAWRVERPATDALAIRLDQPLGSTATRTQLAAATVGLPGWWPGALATFLATRSDPPMALATLREALGAAGLWHVEWARSGVAVLRAGGGERPDTTAGPLAEARARVADEPGHVARGWCDGRTAFAITAGPEGARAALVTGTYPGSTAGPALAEIVLHALADRPPARPPAVGARALPEGVVACPSPPMRALHAEIARYARGRLPVLVLGETGSGKEHVVRLLHAWSDRARGPLVATSCAAIPPDLLDAELFGVEAGAATGVAARPGRLREAHGGVLFLDEVAELTPAAQAALLRALQEREVRPVGGTRAVSVDVRVVAATNVDLAEAVDRGRFRPDLYHRLAGVTLRVPPLRERPEDVAPLCEHVLRGASAELGRPLRGMTVRALEALERAPWRGNVRQLALAVTRAAYATGSDGVVDLEHLPPDLLDAPEDRREPTGPAPRQTVTDDLNLERRVEALERAVLADALARARGNRSEAARLVGLSRNGFRARLARYGLGED